ncbi:CpsD/CapB family tyrosine-protein kinase [Enterococcus gilvus]|uniref:CpsD/CapB family tyrosine-protein kinase n=1 Tax=Enterococcus gilvus TaxID=160453 RepID=UPI0028D72A55|nr:CpsD/CapB family tyrosine-protein kinase [Enterococcus gilvus]MDU5509437.1 CpsD/CapB family tyrosine-protein kinase [Enterococcus gilvus]
MDRRSNQRKRKRKPSIRERRNMYRPRTELITYNNPKSSISEQFRSIRTSIEYSRVSKKIDCFVITSPEAGSGKTTVASNLAVSYAQKGKRTLLIDSDMRRPRVHKLFGLKNQKGLSTELIYPNETEDAFQHSGIENLYILTSGPLPPGPNELLGSETLPILIEKCRLTFDMIIIDTPPISVVSDASILLSRVDGVVLVLRSNNTMKKDARNAVALIERFGGKLLGSVLNGVDERNKEDYYYGY